MIMSVMPVKTITKGTSLPSNFKDLLDNASNIPTFDRHAVLTIPHHHPCGTLLTIHIQEVSMPWQSLIPHAMNVKRRKLQHMSCVLV